MRIVIYTWMDWAIITVSVIATAGAGIYIAGEVNEYYSDEPLTYIHGTEDDPHDAYYGGLVNGDTTFGNFCHGYDTDELEHAVLGDVVIAMRADSYKCSYKWEGYLSYPVIGVGNYEQYVGEDRIENAFSISHGPAWGGAIDYCVDAGSLSEAMPLFANTLLEITAATSSPPTYHQLKEVLDASSEALCESSDGRYYGQVVDVETAKDYIVNGIPQPPPPTDADIIAAWLAGGPDYLLLLSDE